MNKIIQPPWSNKGWYADESKDRETDVDRYARQREGRFRSRVHDHDRPGYVLTPVTHNPYLNLASVPLMIWAGAFLLDKLSEAPWGAVALSSFFWLLAAAVALVSVLRIPAWHRARRRAREFIAEHGGKFPGDLRWFA